MKSINVHALIIDRSFFQCFENSHVITNKDLTGQTRMTDDDFVSGLNSWFIFKNSVVHDSLNKFLLECHQHGIIVYLRQKYKKIIIPEEEKPKILTIYMLSAGFYVWLASVGIAFVVFVIERIHKRVRVTK